MKKPELIVITGPTATGKSAIGVRLAKLTGGEIVSADSMQVYKYMDIGTAKPSLVEMDCVPHHMIDFISPLEDYSVALYVEDASRCVEDIIRRGKQPIIVGGTGLYIDSLITGQKFMIRGDSALRSKLEEEYDNTGGEAMLKKLHAIDAAAAARLFANDKKRIVRALEAYEITGKPISLHDLESKDHPPQYEAVRVALTYSDRADLYSKIETRVDEMMQKGLINEVRSLLNMGVSRKNTSMQAIGYKELSGVIAGEADPGDATDKIKMESRRYAKRQFTWLKRHKDMKWIVRDKSPDLDKDVHILMEYLNETK